MWESLLALLAFSVLLPFGVLKIKMQSQKSFDAQRVCYLINPPSDLDSERVVSFFRAAVGSSVRGAARFVGVPTIVFETYATSDGITHRILVPAMDAEYIVGQLRSLVPGTVVTPIEHRERIQWKAGLKVSMSRPARTVRATEPNDMAASLLASVSSLADDESVLIQWIVSPAPRERPPSRQSARSVEFDLFRAIRGRTEAMADEIDDRRRKLEEQNVLAVGRVVADADTDTRARSLTFRIRQSLSAMHTATNGFNVSSMDELDMVYVNEARTPMHFTAQFTLHELIGVVAWPVGMPFVAGLPRGAARHLHATNDIPSEGRVLGRSNVPGHERPVAIPYARSVEHAFVQGGTSSGKSALLSNLFAQDVTNWFGGIVFDVGSGESHETLFSRAKGLIPPDRVKDVIIIDVSRSWQRPVAFNPLDQGSRRVVVDQLTSLFNYLYGDGKGVWVRELMYHGLTTLLEQPNPTLADLPALIAPTKDEAEWAQRARAGVTDPQIKRFWQRWESYSRSDQDRHAEPVLSRIWQLTNRPEILHMIAQPKSSFTMEEVVSGNKILLVNMAGVPKEAANLLSAILMDSLWNAVRRITPDRPNFLFLDEAQLLKLPMNVEDMLATARKHNLGLTVATQFISALSGELQDGLNVMPSAR